MANRQRPCAACVLLTITLAAPACDVSPTAGTDEAPWFAEVSGDAGLRFTHETGTLGSYFMPEIMGPGSAFLDYDNDGDLDVYLVNGAPGPGREPAADPPRNRLFRHDGELEFVDVTDASGLGDTGYGMGVAVGDYDNDGDVDVYVTNYGPNQLYRNEGDGTFTRVTEQAGVGDPRWGTSATFLDYDADGWLDLFVANYLIVDPQIDCRDRTGSRDYCDVGQFPGDVDRLYRNNGDGTFADVSRHSGIADAAYPGLGVVAADLTEDGWIDIYVANDMNPNLLWVNRGDGAFYDDAVMMGLAYNEAGKAESSMGVVCADLDNDTAFDLFLTHLEGESHTLYRDDGVAFEDVTAQAGIVSPSTKGTGFGALGVDLEHDGDLDLLVANGHVYRRTPEPGAALGPFWNDYAQTGIVLRNDGGRFVDVSRQAGEFGTDPQVGRGLAAGDVDSDGDLDFLMANCHGPARLFLNQVPKQGHWLLVRAFDETLNRDALGAKVTVAAAGRRWVQLINTGYSYLAGNDPRAHFGLGPASRIDSIEVVWPGGVVEKFPGGGVDRAVVLVRGQGEGA